jgi:hypothetical protein
VPREGNDWGSLAQVHGESGRGSEQELSTEWSGDGTLTGG